MTKKEPSGLCCAYRWGINDCHSLDNLLLVSLGAGTVEVANDGGHAGLVAHHGRQVDGLLGVILGEAVIAKSQLGSRTGKERESIPDFHLRLDLSSVSGSTLPGKVSERTVTRSFELSVRHGGGPVVVGGWRRWLS